MTTENKKITELELITQELSDLDVIEAQKAKIKASRSRRRSIAEGGDAGTVQAAQQASDEAQAKVERLEREKADAEGHLGSLNARLDGGDESVGVDDVVSADKAIERLTRLLKPAKQAAKQAERALRPLIADQHLANLSADLLESVTDVPVIVRREVSNAPAITPAVILSQTEATDSFGTLDASGAVKVTEVGETGIDWTAVRAAFADTGSEGSVTSTGITFDRAWWPTPRLAKPSLHAMGEYLSTFEQAWQAQVSGAREAEQLRERGFNASIKTTWGGLFSREGMDLESENGKALGTASFSLAAQHNDGDCLDIDGLRSELTELVNIFREETVGGVTEAGRILSVSLSDMKASSVQVWSRNDVVHRMGSPVFPITATATLRLEFEYEQAEV